MKQFLNQTQKEIQRETIQNLEELGIKPILMPDIQLEIDTQIHGEELIHQKGEYQIDTETDTEMYNEALETVREQDPKELLEDMPDIDNSDQTTKEPERNKPTPSGKFIQRPNENSIVVSAKPFNLVEYATGDKEESYQNWAEDKLNTSPEKAVEKLSQENLFPGDTPSETLFHTVQKETDLNDENELNQSTQNVYQEIIENEKPELILTGVHEGAHASFDENFQYQLPQLTNDTARRIQQTVSQQMQGYGIIEEEFQGHWEKAIEQVAGEQKAQKYRKAVQLNGINEVYARLATEQVRRDSIEEIGREEIYENHSFWTEAEYETENPFTEGGSPAEVSKVDVEEMRDYVMENGFQAVLNLEEQELIENFYDG